MGQERLSHLALISIERIYANAVIENDIDRLIDTFASRKNRKCHFLIQTYLIFVHSLIFNFKV